MREYIVEPGDTLGGIARRLLGSYGKWSVLAEINDLDDPNRLRPGQTLRLPDATTVIVPPVVNPVVTAPAADQTVSFSEEGKRVFANNLATGEKIYLGRKFKRGLARYGLFQPEDVLRSADPLFQELQLSNSEINVLLSTAENEGALDAINTWDNSFLSFGMFQWTAGRKDEPGELAVLLARVKARFPAEFANYWDRFGLDIDTVQGAYGWLSLDGSRLVTAQEKNQLRDYAWVLRFARAGADRRIQAVQVLHAITRLDGFYFQSQADLDGYTLAQLVSSEYGVALLLDNHVNRPGYVLRTVAVGMQQAQLRAAQLAAGGTEVERRFLHHYLIARETYGRNPMTHARERADVTRRYLGNGIISDAKGSFQSNRNQRAATSR